MLWKNKMTNQLVRASVKYHKVLLLNYKSTLVLAHPPPPGKINKKYRHDQPFTLQFWFNSFIISCPELQRDYLLPPPPQRLIKWWCQKLIANPCLLGKLTYCSWYIHNHIRRVISFHFGHFLIKCGQIRLKIKQKLAQQELWQAFSFKLRAAWTDRLENYIFGCTKI